MGIHSDGVPLDFSVNTVSPFYSAALLAESGQIDVRAKELILIVRRWAKDRGISHAAKGHLSPYAWTVLAVYYLQVSTGEVDPILPALTEFKLSSELLGIKRDQQSQAEQRGVRMRKPITTLLQEFFEFYNKEFDWRREAVALRFGKRAPPDQSLPLHVLLDQNQSTVVAPCVADPFVRRHNLASDMTILSIGRLREEIERADELCSRHASLSELLEPWVPPEWHAGAEGGVAETQD
jgi:DNA polymerase sigma